MSTMIRGWVGVDLDGTLAEYDYWRGIDHIGNPVKPMVERVKTWLAQGIEVKIFTARICNGDVALLPIQKWCMCHIGVVLEVTNVKDFAMIELWDDRCVSVEPNTGKAFSHRMLQEV